MDAGSGSNTSSKYTVEEVALPVIDLKYDKPCCKERGCGPGNECGNC